MAIIKKSTNAEDGVEKTEPSYTVGGNVNWYSHSGEQYGGSFKKKKKKIELLYDPAVPLLGKFGEKHDPKGYMHSSVHCSTVYNNQDMEAT